MHPPSGISLIIYLVGNCILIQFNRTGLLDIFEVHPGGGLISPLHQNLPDTRFGLALLVFSFYYCKAYLLCQRRPILLMVDDAFELKYLTNLIVQLGINVSSNLIFHYLVSLTIFQLYLKFCVSRIVFL